MLWIDADGWVHLDPLPWGTSPGRYAQDLGPRLRFRDESYGAGNGYVGPNAADDTAYVKRLMNRLLYEWTEGSSGYLRG